MSVFHSALSQQLRRALLVGALCGALGGAGCSAFGGPPVITLSERELAQHIGRAFPRHDRVLEIFDVQISAPSLRLLPERNRIASRFDLALRDRLFASSYRGRVGFESGLRFEPDDHTVRLAQVRVDELRLEDRDGGGGSGVATLQKVNQGTEVPLQRIGKLLAEQLLEDHVVWRATPEQAQRLRRSGYTAETVTVTSAGIQIDFQPLSR